MGELRESKKRETRQRISDVATALFSERGFDAVTVDEIAAAARVSKVTVFNYFARKEDLHLDQNEDVKLFLREALVSRPKEESPVDALQRLAHRLSEEKHAFAHITREIVAWWHVVAASPSLQARVREMGDEAVEALTFELAGPKADASTRLVAGMVILTWRTAYREALHVVEHGGSGKKGRVAFLDVIDRGFAAIRAIAT